MYYDLISYRLADGITHEHLTSVASQIIQERMTDLPGFISREITQDLDGNYTDIVKRESIDAANNAENQMSRIPNAAERYACYQPKSISTQKLHVKRPV